MIFSTVANTFHTNQYTKMKNLSFRSCPTCSSEFLPASQHQLFCSSNCRQAKFRENRKEKEKELAGQLSNLQSKPQETIDETRVVSTEWSKLKTKLFYAQREHDSLVNAMSSNKSKIKALQNGYNYGWLGVACSTTLIGVYFTLNQYNSPIKRPIKVVIMTCIIIAALVGLFVFVIASLIGSVQNAKNPTVQTKIDELLAQNKALEPKINESERKVVAIEELLQETPEFESEVIKMTKTRFLDEK